MKKVLVFAVILAVLGIALLIGSFFAGIDIYFTEGPAAVLKRKNADDDDDGLSNQEELDFKTDPQNSDTDKDGLFDGEEVRVYKTNPLNEDTDNDGYTDKDEIDAGYDPLKSAKER